jgi:nucleotide-binding universal stress UspA family protein
MSKLRRFLVPTDGSDHARHALQFVLSLAADGVEVEIHLLNVQPAVRGVAASMVSHADLESYHREEGMKVLTVEAAVVEAAGLTPHLHVGVGDAAGTVLAFAERLACDHIVMGTRGLGGVAGLLLGSVARDVAGGAKVPVTLLR